MSSKWMSKLEAISQTWFYYWARRVYLARKPLVIIVTGTVGKTFTKEAVAAVLQHPDARPVLGWVRKTPANRNGERSIAMLFLGRERRLKAPLDWAFVLITLPLRALYQATIARYPRIFVLEYAAWELGSIQRRVDAIPPTIAIVTAVGPAHLDTFINLDNIRHEKGVLARSAPPSGLVLLGADNPDTAAMDVIARAPVIKIPGRGRVFAEAAARVVGRHLGVPDDVIDRALAEMPSMRGRQNVLLAGNMIIMDDAFNANPLSMEFGLDTLATLASDQQPPRRRVAILGMMAEMGPDAVRYHEEVGAYARTRADFVIGVGELATHYRADHWFATAAECADCLPDLLTPTDCILVKGSHSVGLRKVVDRLTMVAKTAPS